MANEFWTNNDFRHFQLRQIDFNRCVCMSQENVEKLPTIFDNLLANFTSFANEISSVTLYPFRILPYLPNGADGNYYLKTSKGTFSGITAYRIDYSAYYITLGEFYVEPYFNNFADYKGYTQIKVFLPMLGFVDIDVNECMGRWLQFRLTIDFTSGKGMYLIGVSDNSVPIGVNNEDYPYPPVSDGQNFRVIATYEVDLGVEIPVGRSNVSEIKRNLLLGAVKVATAVGVASYTNSLPPPTTTTTVEDVSIGSARGDYKGARMKPMTMTQHTSTSTETHNKPVNKSKPYEEAINGSIDVINRNFHTQSSDRVNDSSLMWQASPYVQVVIIRPKMLSIDDRYKHLYGQPLGEVIMLSEISGYTEVSKIHFEGSGFDQITAYEYSLIEQAFSEGVILPETSLPERIDGALTFSSPNSFTLKTSNTRKNWDGELEYSTDTKTWNVWDGTTTLLADSGKLYMRGTGNTKITGSSRYNWVLTGDSISCLGNIENLLDYTTVVNGEHPTMANYCYRGMFRDCTSLTQAPELPATTLQMYCYSDMFDGCTSLTTAPELPATILEEYCYEGMLRYCTSLIQAPELPATTMKKSCYFNMFDGCTSLKTAPELPATILAEACYENMFANCTSLITAPELPVTTLQEACYSGMFIGCTSLTTAPELPATTLVGYCYFKMFRGCSKIKLSKTQTGIYQIPYRIPTSGTGKTATLALYEMFTLTGGTFTGEPSINTTYYTSNTVV